MLLGILSDTHNRLDALRAGLAVLDAVGAEMIVHCGDVGETPLLDLLAGRPNAVVWGNTDFERARLGSYAQSIGVNIHHPAAYLELEGKQIVVTHGDDGRLIRSILVANTADYLLMGHTHEPLDELHGRVRVINPGALHRANPKTVATLDLSSGSLRHIEVQV